MDRTHSCQMLIKWLETFDVEAPHTTAADLSDGVAMAEILHQIAPTFFSQEWLSNIRMVTINTWNDKVDNLKIVLKRMRDFFASLPQLRNKEFHLPDLVAIGEHQNVTELVRMLQLILVCAVYCDENTHIHRIMSMEETVQQVIMNMINEVLGDETTSNAEENYSRTPDQEDSYSHIEEYSGSNEHLKRMSKELNQLKSAKEDLTQNCHFLDEQMMVLQEEKSGLLKEIDRLTERLNEVENLDPSTSAGKRYQQLQRQIQQLNDQLAKAETVREEYKTKLEILSEESRDLHQKNLELRSLAEEARSMKDEIDELRYAASKVAKFESMIESYKKKFAEVSDLRNQIKELQKSNTNYMEENLKLEQEKKKVEKLKQQLHDYMRQVSRLENDVSYQSRRAAKAEQDYKTAQNKMLTLQKDKEKITAERDALREVVDNEEENQYMGCQGSETQLDEKSELLLTDLEMLSIPLKLKEKIIRLMHDNKTLKAAQHHEVEEDMIEQNQKLQSRLDENIARIDELETQLMLSNQKNIELQAEVDELQLSQLEPDTLSEISDLKRLYNEQLQKSRSMDSELQEKKQQLEETESQLSATAEQNQKLQDMVNKKDDAMKKLEERYKRYLEKAKAVIKTLDPKQNISTAPEIQALKNQLDEKQKLIEHLEKNQERNKAVREEEEKLMVTAWYNLSMQLNQRAVDERLANNVGQSFLTRQRQAHARRLQNISNTNSMPTR